MVIKGRHLLLTASLVSLSVSACGKKKEKNEEEISVSTNVSTPVNALSIVGISLKSAAAGIGTNATMALSGGFSADDCDEHAEPKARTGEPADSSGRLDKSHDRYALQQLYCLVQTDTGSPDSFIGSISESKFLACLMGGNLTFDGAEHDVTITKAAVLACASDYLPSSQQGEVSNGVPEAGINAKLTAGLGSQNPINTAGGWDAGMKLSFSFGGQPMSLGLLVSDNANVTAVGVTNASQGASFNQDGYVATIDKANGAIRYESMFQRIRTVNGTSSNGWNRHARVYVKGTMDSDYKFSSVSKAQGIYSDISVNDPSTTPSDPSNPAALPLKSGTLWAVNGGEPGGFVSKMYNLGTLSAPNVKASWEVSTPVSACNGDSSSGDCTNTALSLASNADTAFAMDLNNSAFVKVEEWIQSTSSLTFTDLTFAASQQ